MLPPEIDLVVHATHEAGLKLGGIGAVLEGLLSQPAYNRAVRRTVLVGPYDPSDPLMMERLHAPRNGLRILYSGLDEISNVDPEIAHGLERVELYYHVNVLYGMRRFGETDHEVLLVDPRGLSPDILSDFKYHLWERYGVESRRYEYDAEYNAYLRAAEPSYAALQALIGEGRIPRPPALGPARAGRAVLIAHEWLGLPLAFAAVRHQPGAYRTVFYAHEVATIRPLVEDNGGHDTRFYNVMFRAREQGLRLEDVFGDQYGYYKHALIHAAAQLDGFFAVSDLTLQELLFLSPGFGARPVARVYNGVPSAASSMPARQRARAHMRGYARNLFGFEPTWIFTHITRMVLSKGLWRDVRVMEQLDRRLTARGERAVLFTLSSAVPAGRRGDEVREWEAEYGWPVEHRAENGDLVGLEARYDRAVQEFNRTARASRIVLINQFGWSRDRCGLRMPEEMEPGDARQGTDVEFGQSIYEPFGIGQLEPLTSGAICCVSNVCGCVGALGEAQALDAPNVLVADYVSLPPLLQGLNLGELLNLGTTARELVETGEAARVAAQLIERLPRSPEQAQALLEGGYALSQKLSWSSVVETGLVPALFDLFQ